MKFEETQYFDAVPVDSYGPGFFRIRGEVVTGSLLLFEGQVHGCDRLEALSLLKTEGLGVDVIFIGTGAALAPLEDTETAKLKALDIGYELMATPTACRMYNVLLSEGRKVALIAQDMP